MVCPYGPRGMNADLRGRRNEPRLRHNHNYERNLGDGLRVENHSEPVDASGGKDG